nr:reverse transcriptase domain-containing protein [Tanacetum cinerariifolium]
MVDNRIMEELLQAPTEGYGEAIVIPEINADHFEIKMNLLQLVQANPYHGFERENPHTHINNFKRITSTLKFKDVPNDCMRTKNSYFPNNPSVTIPRRQNRRRAPNKVEPEIRTIVEFAPMADNQTMEELLQAPTEGYGEAIVIPEINADHFEIKTNLLKLVQANPYHGFERENPHTHINNFKRITSTMKFRDVSNDVIKLMMFPYSLEGAARVWYDKEPPNSILTWDDLVSKFVNHFFSPSKTTHLKNEISRFTQIFEETFGEAWEQFKEMLRACPHHGFTELTQIDTFYNGLNENDQDSLNTAAGGNLLMERETEETTDKEQTNFQGSTADIQPPVVPILEPDVLKTLPKPDLHFDVSFADALPLMPKFGSTIKSLLANKDKLFELAKIPLNENCSAMLLKKLPLGKVFETSGSRMGTTGGWMSARKLSLPELTPTRMTLELADRSITYPKGVVEDVFVKVRKFHFLTDFVVVDFKADPRVPLILGRSFLRTSHTLTDVYRGEITLRVNDEAVTFNLNQNARYSSTYDDMSVNRIDVIDVAREEYAQEMLGFSNNSSEEIEAYLKDELISPKTDHADCDPEGDICLIENLLNDEPFQLPSMDLK